MKFKITMLVIAVGLIAFSCGFIFGKRKEVKKFVFEDYVLSHVISSLSVYMYNQSGNTEDLKDLIDIDNYGHLLKVIEYEAKQPVEEYIPEKIRGLYALSIYWEAYPPKNPYLEYQGHDSKSLSKEWESNMNKINELFSSVKQQCETNSTLKCRVPNKLLNKDANKAGSY